MTNIPKYDLISSIISLINSEEYESTITNISASLSVPIQYIRKSILALLNNRILQSCINSEDDYEIIDDEPAFMEKFVDCPEKIADNLIDGIYDDIVWDINLKIPDNNEHEILSLTQLEYSALKAMGENILSLKRNSLFEKKEITQPLSPAIKRIRDMIQDAIINKKAITFNYKSINTHTGQLEQSSVVCFPQEIITNVSDNWLYVQSTELKLYRLDRIAQPCRIVNNSEPFPGISVNPNRKYIWGACSNPDDVPVHVKLRIAPETSNIITKIKYDTALRAETGKLYQDGGFYYYEDDIIGLNEFQRWIRSYGSSIVVIEPESLRNNIVERAQQAINLYELSKSWNDL